VSKEREEKEEKKREEKKKYLYINLVFARYLYFVCLAHLSLNIFFEHI